MTGERPHVHGFDVLRAIGIAAIVWIHGADTHPTIRATAAHASFAVPCFILMSFFLLQTSFRSAPALPLRFVIARRLARLLPAYLLWTAVHMAARALKHHLLSADRPPEWHWASILFCGGASYQLYFVMALVYWTALVAPILSRAGRPESHRRAWAASLAGAAVVLLWAGPRLAAHWAVPPDYALLTHAASLSGYVPAGAAMALLWGGIWRNRGLAVPWAMAAIGLLLAVLAPRFRSVISLLFFGAALLYPPTSAPRWILSLSRHSYGMFMTHSLFVEGLQAAARVAGHPIESAVATVAVIACSFAGSYALCLVLSRLRGLRRFVL